MLTPAHYPTSCCWVTVSYNALNPPETIFPFHFFTFFRCFQLTRIQKLQLNITQQPGSEYLQPYE